MNLPQGMIGRRAEWRHLADFASSGAAHATLGIVWGRRRVGKSYLLQALSERMGGFYHCAVRGSSAEALAELGRQLGAWQESAAPLALKDWTAAIEAILAAGRKREIVVVLDEYPYLQEHTPEIDSIIQRAFGPRSEGRMSSRTRLILCGSAMAVMGGLRGGTAPLYGRASLDLRVSAFDFRLARELHGIEDGKTAFNAWAVIGGVPAYAREMVDGDLPSGPADFDRWVARRVLSPATPLFQEVDLLLSEDPTLSRTRKVNLYHSVLANVAAGNHAHGRLTKSVGISGASLAPIIDTLVSTGLVERLLDPIRENRPTYHPADPLIRFHYAVIRPHRVRLDRHDADGVGIWKGLRTTFESRVLGPCFEGLARYWTAALADSGTIGGEPGHVGPTTLSMTDGSEREIDVVVAAAGGVEPASERLILAIGEAKAGEKVTTSHLRWLEETRRSLGERAAGARLLLFGTAFGRDIAAAARRRPDVELIDLDRLYGGG